MTNTTSEKGTTNEKGFALLMTVFIISLATIVVLEAGRLAHFDHKSSKAFAESIQGDYVLKSGVNLGRLLLELPKLEGINEDWMGDPWAIIGAAPSLPIDGIIGEPRIAIVDDGSKLNINSVVFDSSQAGLFSGFNQGNAGGTISQARSAYWKTVAARLFESVGIQREEYAENSFLTPGDVGLGPSLLPSVIDDWVDADKQSFSSEHFIGEGIESFAPKELFFNRKLYSLHDMLNVPGFSADRLRKLSPYIFAESSGNAAGHLININTASAELLSSMGLAGTEISEILSERTNLPLTRQMLNTLLAPYPELKGYFGVQSKVFTIIVRANMPNRTRWLEARVTTSGSPARRFTYLISEVYR